MLIQLITPTEPSSPAVQWSNGPMAGGETEYEMLVYILQSVEQTCRGWGTAALMQTQEIMADCSVASVRLLQGDVTCCSSAA